MQKKAQELQWPRNYCLYHEVDSKNSTLLKYSVLMEITQKEDEMIYWACKPVSLSPEACFSSSAVDKFIGECQPCPPLSNGPGGSLELSSYRYNFTSSQWDTCQMRMNWKTAGNSGNLGVSFCFCCFVWVCCCCCFLFLLFYSQCLGQNPGPYTCETNILPLSSIPFTKTDTFCRRLWNKQRWHTLRNVPHLEKMEIKT